MTSDIGRPLHHSKEVAEMMQKVDKNSKVYYFLMLEYRNGNICLMDWANLMSWLQHSAVSSGIDKKLVDKIFDLNMQAATSNPPGLSYIS